jgi:hypothetical protein
MMTLEQAENLLSQLTPSEKAQLFHSVARDTLHQRIPFNIEQRIVTG